MKTEERVIDLGGMRVKYSMAGSGPSLILLHGGGEAASSWRWVMPRLGERFRLIAPDLPGHGGSSRPRGYFTIPMFGEFLGEFLDALCINRAAIVGHSLGGLTALQFALDRPGRVTALSLVAAAGLGPEISPLMIALSSPVLGDWGTAWASTPIGQLQRLTLRAAGCFSSPVRIPSGWLADQLMLGLHPGQLWDQLLLSRVLIDGDGQRAPLLDRLGEVQVPTLILWGDSDMILPASQGVEAGRRIRNARLAVIPDCGHMPQVECPDAFLEALMPFLASAGALGYGRKTAAEKEGAVTVGG